VTSDSQPGQSNDGDDPAPSAAALRMRRHRERRRDGLRCMTIELRETEVTALIRRRFLAENARKDRRAVLSADAGDMGRLLRRVRNSPVDACRSR
jgi:hypothetical protein